MEPTRTQGSIAGGVAFIFASALFLAFMIVSIVKNGWDSLTFVFALAALLFLCLGVYGIRRGVVNQKVATKGRRGKCVIEKFKTVGGKGPVTIWMTVSYVDDSGQKQNYAARVNDEAITNLKKGMVLECRILGKECYVDPNNIRVIEGEEAYV